MLECFQEVNFRRASLKLIDTCNDLLDRYRKQSIWSVTLRQLYYRFIGLDLLPSSWIDPLYNVKHHLPLDTKNTVKNYKRLGALVSDARLAGLIDWEAIEDRTRDPRIPLEFQDINHRVRSALDNYRLPRWEGQEHYVELWVEKDAIAGMLQPIASEFHVPLVVNRGYSSTSAMKDAAERYAVEVEDGRSPIIFYVGDHDPSGEDMVRDVRDRLEVFQVEDVDVRKLALTREQIEQFKLPPNPAKTSDKRAARYIAKHGANSWEVDALDPATLASIIRGAFNEVIDRELMDAVIEQEDKDKERLREALGSLLE